jgi:hypothetical protein
LIKKAFLLEPNAENGFGGDEEYFKLCLEGQRKKDFTEYFKYVKNWLNQNFQQYKD